ncbi:MAG: LPS assembly lipoprotein LptE [Isosphaeraceae bacterium]
MTTRNGGLVCHDRPAARGDGRLTRRAAAAAFFASLGLSTGCSSLPTPSSAAEGGFFGWHIQAPFDTSEGNRVFVYFKSNRYRRDLQLMLEEAVMKEISMRTPFVIVGRREEADSILEGVITVDDKYLIVEAPTNLPRELTATMTVWINWRHNPPQESEKHQLPTQITEALPFVPELGQTALTSFQPVTENIAKQIGDMMERPWFNEGDVQ